MLLCIINVINKYYLDQIKLRYFSSRFNNRKIKRYSTTLLLVGGITSAAHSRATEQIYHIQSNNDAILQSMVAEFALANGDIPTALHNYTVLAIRSNSTSIKQRALNIAIEQENLQSALDIARHWVVQEPKDVPAKFYLAHIALKAHEYELAAQTLNSILTLDPNADLEKILAGIMPDSEQDRNDLLNTLKASQKKDNPSILVLIAGLEAQNGHLEQALQSVNKALRKRPKVTSFILFKANLLLALGNQQEVEEWFAKSSRKNSRNLEVRLAEVRFLIKHEKAEEALEKLQKMLLIWPNSDEALFIAGLTAIDLKDYELAEKYLIELRDSDQYQNEAYYYLAINAERKQQLETAKAYYRLVDGNLYTVSRRNLISIYAHQERLNDALRFLTQERVNYPQHANFLYLAQAEILKKMGHKEAALSLLSEAVENLPDDPEILYAQILLLDPFEDRNQLDLALYAPDDWQHLQHAFPQDIQGLKLLGLIRTSDNGRDFDLLRDRVIFPIRDSKGRVVGFGGRALNDEIKPKYINSPDSEVFHKNRLLYGLYEGRKQKAHDWLMVEGYMDVIALQQAGVYGAVATLGTASNEEHLNILFKQNNQLTIAFDGDAAGQKAARRTLEIALPLLSDGRELKFFVLPDQHDPDSLMRQEGFETFNRLWQQSPLLSDFIFALLSQQHQITTPEGKSQVMAELNQLTELLPKHGSYRYLLRQFFKEKLGFNKKWQPQVSLDASLSFNIRTKDEDFATAILIHYPYLYSHFETLRAIIQPDQLLAQVLTTIDRVFDQLPDDQEQASYFILGACSAYHYELNEILQRTHIHMLIQAPEMADQQAKEYALALQEKYLRLKLKSPSSLRESRHLRQQLNELTKQISLKLLQ